MYSKKFAHIHIPKCAGVDILMFFGCKMPTDKSMIIKDKEKLKRYGKVFCPVIHHHTIKMVKKKLPKDCITFSVIRNPWDRMVSNYLHQRKKGVNLTDAKSFEEYVERIPWGKVVDSASQLYWLTDSEYSTEESYTGKRNFQADQFFPEEIIVDHLLRIENMKIEWWNLCRIIDIAYRPLSKTHINKGREHYSHYYNNRTKKIIELCYQEEIERFKYKYEVK